MKVHLKSPVGAAVAASVLTATVVGGVALAQPSDPAVITVCVKQPAGSVRIVS